MSSHLSQDQHARSRVDRFHEPTRLSHRLPRGREVAGVSWWWSFVIIAQPQCQVFNLTLAARSTIAAKKYAAL
jgi:hypothetical protein